MLLVLCCLLLSMVAYAFDRPVCFTGTEECKQYENNGVKIIETYKNKHLLFIGDSLTRYQYLDLVYTLRYGTPQNNTADPSITVVKETGVWEKWNPFFDLSHKMIGPNEVADSCSCWRNQKNSVLDYWFDNRYYYDPINNIRVTFITFFRMSQGRISSKDVTKKNVTNPFEEIPLYSSEMSWRFDNVKDTLMDYVGELENRPDFIVINVGHWHNVISADDAFGIVNAAAIVGEHFIWKTTTYSVAEKPEERAIQNQNDAYFADPMLKEAVTIMDTSWTKELHPSYYPNDRLHFRNPVYSALNDQLADIVNRIKHDESNALE